MVASHLFPGEHVKEEGNEGEQEYDGHDDYKGDTSIVIVGALVTSESEACRVVFTAHGAIWSKEISNLESRTLETGQFRLSTPNI